MKSSISYSLFNPYSTLENRFLTGTDNLNAQGNQYSNLLIGNSGDNVLDGLGGSDVMRAAPATIPTSSTRATRSSKD